MHFAYVKLFSHTSRTTLFTPTLNGNCTLSSFSTNNNHLSLSITCRFHTLRILSLPLNDSLEFNPLDADRVVGIIGTILWKYYYCQARVLLTRRHLKYGCGPDISYGDICWWVFSFSELSEWEVTSEELRWEIGGWRLCMSSCQQVESVVARCGFIFPSPNTSLMHIFGYYHDISIGVGRIH